MNIIHKKIFSSRKIQRYCRMCEEKLPYETKDGMCIKCHTELCRNVQCDRCWGIADNLLRWTARIKEQRGN